MDGYDYQVVWNGSMDRNGECPSLIPNRETKFIGIWVPPKRMYNKTGDYWKVPHPRKTTTMKDVDNPLEDQPKSENSEEQEC